MYWGCENIGQYFDVGGIVIWNELSELVALFSTLTVEKYNSMQASIETNFLLASNFTNLSSSLFDSLFLRIRPRLNVRNFNHLTAALLPLPPRVQTSKTLFKVGSFFLDIPHVNYSRPLVHGAGNNDVLQRG